MLFGAPIGTIVAIYFVAWWICLFLTLPFGVRSQRETGDVVRGSEAGAPVFHRLWPKVAATTVLAAIATALILWGMSNETLREYLR